MHSAARLTANVLGDPQRLLPRCCACSEGKQEECLRRSSEKDGRRSGGPVVAQNGNDGSSPGYCRNSWLLRLEPGSDPAIDRRCGRSDPYPPDCPGVGATGPSLDHPPRKRPATRKADLGLA